MGDEKWIHEQIHDNLLIEEKPKHHFIMSKCFVVFNGIKQKGKRKKLIGRHIFITSNNSSWIEFMDEISQIYDFEQIDEINFFSDSGNWLLAGTDELKLFPNNVLIINTCEFHVKQKINRMTTDKQIRKLFEKVIYEDCDKKKFVQLANELIESKPDNRKEKLIDYKNYITKHWKSIINMKYCEAKFSMESHISHCIAEQFGSRPKGYSKEKVSKYLKLHEYFLNGINIYDLYLKTYNNEDYVYNEKELNFSIFEQSSSNVPILYNAKHFLSDFI